MKSLRFAYLILFLLFAAVIINSVAVGRVIESIADEVSAAEEKDMAAAKEEYEALYKKYKRYEAYVSLSVDHDDLSNLENGFSEIIGAARADDSDALITAKSRLCDCLRHIKRLSGINIDSIF